MSTYKVSIQQMDGLDHFAWEVEAQSMEEAAEKTAKEIHNT